jgi:hypothetical protein
MVRGEDIDPFTYRINYHIIFPHDPQTLEPLWDPVQKQILEMLGLLSGEWGVRASGQVLVYESRGRNACKRLLQRVEYFRRAGWTLRNLKPCRLLACLWIGRGGSGLKVSIEESGSTCKVYVEGLRIPNAPHATQHFTMNLERLVRRDDYKRNLPPWSIFRVSEQKFREYRIAWQEIAKYFEASHLPIQANTGLCTSQAGKLIVPIQKVYFISERDKCTSLIMLAYLNSSLIRSIMKLIAWSARGGYFEHISYTVGHLPLPPLQNLKNLCDEVAVVQNGDLNEAAKAITKKAEQAIAKSLGLDEKEYEEVVSFGKWLNEIANAPLEAVEIGYEIDDESEEEI